MRAPEARDTRRETPGQTVGEQEPARTQRDRRCHRAMARGRHEGSGESGGSDSRRETRCQGRRASGNRETRGAGKPEVLGLLSQHRSYSRGTCRIPAAASPWGPATKGRARQRLKWCYLTASAGPFPISQVNTGRRRRLPLLTLLHPGEVSSSLASPHGNSRSSSENRLSRRQRRQQLLQSSPGRRLYSASLASPPARLLATDAPPSWKSDVRVSLRRALHGRAQGRRRLVTVAIAPARGETEAGGPGDQLSASGQGPGAQWLSWGRRRGRQAPARGQPERARALEATAYLRPHAGVGRPWGGAAEAEASRMARRTSRVSG